MDALKETLDSCELNKGSTDIASEEGPLHPMVNETNKMSTQNNFYQQ
jgi:hypothetical protein